MVKKVTKKAKKNVVVGVGQVEQVRKDELAKLSVAVPAVVGRVVDMVVSDATGETVAYEAVVEMKQMVRNADQSRKRITGPLDAAKKATMAMFKEQVGPLEEAIRVLSGKIAACRDLQEQLAAKAEQKRLAEIAELERKYQEAEDKANARKTMKGRANAMAKADEIEDEIEELEQVEYVADRGAATVAKIWTYEVTDDGQVPREYCEPDRGLLRAAVRGGVRKIAGVRIFQESSIRSR